MNETLRDSFYETPVWNYDKCKKHSLFISNSGSALKGAHQVLKALPIILSKYPDTVVNFCGSSVMSNDWKTLLRFQGYHLYLRRLVKKLGLQAHVNFLGALTEAQMKQAFLDANVYVMPSAIENSPNSLCEAQILGVPVVASYCGGTPTLVEDGKTGYLYRYEEVEMLAQQIMRLFDCNDFYELSKEEMNIANNRHNPQVNAERLVEIYKQISEYYVGKIKPYLTCRYLLYFYALTASWPCVLSFMGWLPSSKTGMMIIAVLSVLYAIKQRGRVPSSIKTIFIVQLVTFFYIVLFIRTVRTLHVVLF